MKYKTFNEFIETVNSINENRVKDLGDRLKDLQQRSATTDGQAQRLAPGFGRGVDRTQSPGLV